ncbi:hypothetical protein [Aeoliella mucimassa]|uniref:Uncharacterized protein n=1 Tax=Aeoliella mucimassa TaxID=2527972 RepID=A0A518AHC8_9BACT|nr:hypothetical protein [Aeoliella mucimassa]QDU54133.1 hypothetical protein Pan181_03130 [Aeoliella mucimassa]
MCIFSQPVMSVSSTQIFARATSQGTQLLAYQMSYESQDENAMILPLPIRRPVHEGSLRFVDLSDYDDFFDDLTQGFPFVAPEFSIGCAAFPDETAEAVLEVFEVGNYIASFVPTLGDFERLDERFTLSKEIWEQLPEYANYGFAVFQLAAGSLKPHPMAFEFEGPRDSLFFPTLHIHDGEIHELEEFDHEHYLQHAGFDSRVHGYRNWDVEDESTGLVRSKYPAKDFCDIDRTEGLVDGNLLVHRKVIRGSHPNQDTPMATYGDPTRRTFNFRPWLPLTPYLLVAAAVTWFFARRSRIKKLRERQVAGESPS